jgi:hypothetical protein
MKDTTLTLQNFLEMQPDMPQMGKDNQHYLISGVDPLYYLQETGVQEQTVAPMAAARTFAQILTVSTGTYFVNVVPSRVSSYDVVGITNTGYVYGISSSVLTPFGFLTMTSDFATIASFDNHFWVSYEHSTSLYQYTFSSGLWASVYSFNGVIPYARPFCQFNQYLYTIDIAASGLASISQVKRIDTGIDVTVPLDFGTGWNIWSLENFNNRYLAIGAFFCNENFNTIPNGTDWYVFLWDGFSNEINLPIKLPGALVDLKAIGSQLYALIKERSGQYALYQFVGQDFKRLFGIAIDLPKSTTNGGATRTGVTLFSYGGMVGINLASLGQLLYGSGRFILTPQNMDIVCATGTSGIIYATAGTQIYLYGSGYSPILYRSQWLPKPAAGIVVHYASGPQGAGDAIQVTLDGFDEEGNASSGLALTAITSATKYNDYKTPLDAQGFKGQLCRVTLSTTSGGTWQPIIRGIDLI